MSFALIGVLFFLAVSLVLYALLGGADFGAGILELSLGSKFRQEQREIISRAIAPVWEANHMWLIIAVVILFMGFPKVYTTMSIYLFIPLLCLLLGIVGRGCAFSFRYYDTLSSDYHLIFSRLFSLSSVWSAFFLGNIVGSLMLGKIDPTGKDFQELFIVPWLNSFSIAMGLFTVCLFGFLASIYLIGETKNTEIRSIFLQKAKLFNVLLVIAGGLVFVSAHYNGLGLVQRFFTDGICIASFTLATILFFPLWKRLHQNKGKFIERILAIIVVGFVFVGWYAVQYPVMVRFSPAANLEALDFFNSQAPSQTLVVLLIALIVGSGLIFPALGYLLIIFNWETLRKK